MIAAVRSKAVGIMSKGKRLSQVMSYPAFMQRQRVLRLYRSMLQAVKLLERDDIKSDLTNQIQREFRINIKVKDPVSVRSLMSEGSRQLEILKDMGTASKSDLPSMHQIDSSVTSWLDSSTEDDVKGRIGTGWPWDK